MPKPAAEMRVLLGLIGSWTTHETIEPSRDIPSGATSSGTMIVRLGPGGFSIVLNHRSKGPMGPYAGRGVIAWNPNEQEYRLAWTDSMAPGMAFETGHKQGNSLIFTGETLAMGKKIAVREVIDIAPDAFTLTIYTNDGSGEKKTMTITHTRKEPAAQDGSLSTCELR